MTPVTQTGVWIINLIIDRLRQGVYRRTANN